MFKNRRRQLTTFSFAAAVVLAVVFFARTIRAGEFVLNPSGGVFDIDQRLANRVHFPLVLSQPGTYRLTSSLTVPSGDAFNVAFVPTGVTIDLNGFSITGSGGGDGIHVAANNSATIENGTIANFSSGVDAAGATVRVQKVQIIASTSSIGTGVRCGVNCIITGNTLIGSGSGGVGIDAARSIISNNIVTGWLDGIIDVGFGSSTITSNTVNNNSDTGILASFSHVSGNTANNNTLGIKDLSGNSNISGNTASNNKTIGIQGKNSTIEGNMVASNGASGIITTGISNVSNNNVSGNGQDGIGAANGNLTNNQVSSNKGNGITLGSGLINGNVVRANTLVGLNMSDVTTGYLNNTVGNNAGGNVVNGTNRGGNLCFQGTITTDCP